jgi:hypothetical protein
MNNNTCRKCGAIDSYKPQKKLLMNMVVCTNSACGDVMIPEEYEKYKVISNPRCPNKECENHKNPPPAKLGFVISVVEEGLMGKIFKSEAYGIVSCKKCGEVIGVGGKG